TVTALITALNSPSTPSTLSTYTTPFRSTTTDNYTTDTIGLFSGDFNHDGRTDIGIATARGAQGLNFQVMLSTGSSFSDAAVWNCTDDYSPNHRTLSVRDFNHHRFADIAI